MASPSESQSPSSSDSGSSPQPSSSSSPTSEPMQVFVKDVAGNTTALTLTPSTTIAELKTQLLTNPQRTSLNLPSTPSPSASSLRLIYAGRRLDASATLASLNLPANATIHLALPLRGGMAPKKTRCKYKDCKERAQPIIGDCGFCGDKFCARHRLLESHECRGLEDCRDEERERNRDKLEAERTVAVKGV